MYEKLTKAYEDCTPEVREKPILAAGGILEDEMDLIPVSVAIICQC